MSSVVFHTTCDKTLLLYMLQLMVTKTPIAAEKMLKPLQKAIFQNITPLAKPAGTCNVPSTFHPRITLKGTLI